MHPFVRRALEGLVLLLGVGFIGATLYTLNQSGAGRPTRKPSAPTVSVSGLTELDIPCHPWTNATSDEFICVDDTDDPPTLRYGTLEKGLTTSLLSDDRLSAGIWDAAWAGDGATVLLILQGDDERAGIRPRTWPVLAVDTAQALLYDVGTAAAGALLQRRPDGSVVFQSQEGVTIYEEDGRTRTVPFGLNASVFPLTLDLIRLSPTTDEVAARLIVAQAGGALRLINRATQHETLIDQRLYRAERPFDWSPTGAALAYTNRNETNQRPMLWRYTLTDAGKRLLWEAPGAGRIDFVTWLPEAETILFTFTPRPPNVSRATRYYALATDARTPLRLWTNGHGLQIAAGGETVLFNREFTDDTPLEKSIPWIARLQYPQ